MELTSITPIDDRLMHQERSNYWLDTEEMGFIVQSEMKDAVCTNNHMTSDILNFLLSFVDRALLLGHFRDELMENKNESTNILGMEYNGYFPLEEEMAQLGDDSNGLKQRAKALRDDPKELLTRARAYISEEEIDVTIYNDVQLARITKLLESSKEKGINLIFVLLPRSASPELLGLFYNIPPQSRIDLCNPILFPEFYDIEHSFDVGHLNTKGAELMTKKLAESYLALSGSSAEETKTGK